MKDPSIGILDCGSGNLRSVYKAFTREGSYPVVSREVDPAWDGLVLPGVGAFGHAMRSVNSVKDDLLAFIEEGKPFLGICLGLQVLFESSEENPGLPGLCIIKGKVVRIKGDKVPHMGWNSLDLLKKSHILKGIQNGSYFYFVHSYVARANEDVTVATCEYSGQALTAVIERENIHACQFHPEKSGEFGLRIVRNFINISRGSF